MRNILLFLLLYLSFLFLGVVSEGMLNTNELISNSLVNHLTNNQAEHLLATQARWWWLGYAFMPIILICKLSIVTFVLYTGLLLLNVKSNLSSIFNIVVQAEFIFFVSATIKTLWFYYIYQGFTIKDLQYWQPLSLLNFFGQENVTYWSIYPLQLINLFELLYFLVLAHGLQSIIKKSFKEAFSLVAASYGTGLVLWVAFITFITVSIGA